MENRIIPEFGPLSGMRVICTGSLIAMPFASSMLAEFGAEVIEIERPGVGDRYRHFPPTIEYDGGRVGTSWIQEARNRLSMTLELNLNNEDAREIFLGLIKQADIYMENMVWLEKLGIRDEELMTINPRLVIVHVSGFGHKEFGGVPEMCNMASYDIIGQAFSGFMQYNGNPEKPMIVKPSHNDYVSAMFTLFGALTAYISAKETGKGQVVDVSQFEAQAKIMQDAFTRTTLNMGKIERSGGKVHTYQPWEVFKTKNGDFMAVGAVGAAVFNRFIAATGMDPEYFTHDEVAVGQEKLQSLKGREFFKLTEEWFASHNTEEIIKIMQKHRVPCGKVNTSEDCLNDPHFNARKDFITYHDQTLDIDVKAYGIVPKFSETPGKVWRGAPRMGQDTDVILSKLLGYSEEKISELHRKGIV